MSCAEMRLLVQADADGELRPGEAARVAAHLETCAECAALQASLLDLSARLRAELPRPELPATLRHWAASRAGAPAGGAMRLARHRPARAGIGLALAAGLALFLLLPGPPPVDGAQALLDDHLRALQPGHLMDVTSTDQHTVKPWFDGRTDFAPPVKDLRLAGFPLIGGRLDYVGGRPAAALVYQRRAHIIDLFVWPDPGPDRAPATTVRRGYVLTGWRQGGMALRAVSDVGADDLAAFVRLWRGG